MNLLSSESPFILRVQQGERLISPADMRADLEPTPEQLEQREQHIRLLNRILARQDARKLLIVGPCSLHEPDASLEYARKLKDLADQVSDSFVIMMRAYFEKPRTTVGWKGWINEANLDGKHDMNEGYRRARAWLKALAEIGLPAATEIIHPLSTLYLFDLVSWVCIGARTVESQIHREFASGMSTPVGFKNGTGGEVVTAVNAMQACKQPHTFIGCDDDAKLCHLHTTGNEMTHLILRGGTSGTNYHADAVNLAVEQMRTRGLTPNVMVDCCHGNSQKQPSRVPAIFNDVIQQIVNGNDNIIGLMLESFLVEGRQDIPDDLSQLTYGQSVTDPCIGWDMTENLILNAHDMLQLHHA